MPTANEAILDASVSRQIFLQRLSTKAVREIIKTLNSSEKHIVEQLAQTDLSDFSQTRLRGLLTEFANSIQNLMGYFKNV